MQKYNFSVEAACPDQQDEAVMHAYGLPCTSCAVAVAVSLVAHSLSLKSDGAAYSQSAWFYCTLWLPCVIMAAHIYLGRDSPPAWPLVV